MTGTADRAASDGRLLILRELALQVDGRSNDIVLQGVLDAHGYGRSRDWIRTQLRALVDLGAIRLQELPSVFVATLRAAGRDHVERRGVIEGVARPADAD